MSRIVSSANATALQEPNAQIAIAVDMDFPSGHVRLHDGCGPLTIGGNAYEGTGKVHLLDKIEESIDVIAKPVSVVLSGVDASMITTARAGGYQGRDITFYLCVFSLTSGSLIDTPEVAWEGKMDSITIRLGQGEASLRLNCEHRLRREPRIARYTNQDQQLAYSGDRFFDLVPSIPGFKSKWGEKGLANDGTRPGGILGSLFYSIMPPGP
jgi:hypothetical protein